MKLNKEHTKCLIYKVRTTLWYIDIRLIYFKKTNIKYTIRGHIMNWTSNQVRDKVIANVLDYIHYAYKDCITNETKQ